MDYSLIQLDRTKPVHLFAQLTSALRQLFACKPNLKGELLPSIREMSQILQLNRATIQKAYAELEKDGTIIRASAHHYQIAPNLGRKSVSPYHNIGIILPTSFRNLMSPQKSMTAQILTGIIDTAASHHLSTIMLTLPDFNASTAEINAFNRDISQKLTGLIHLGGRGNVQDNPLRAVMKNTQIPQIMVAAYPILPHIGAVVFDLTNGANALALKLRDLNHWNIGIVTESEQLTTQGSRDCLLTYDCFRRAELIRDILLAHGLNCQPKFDCLNCTSRTAVYNSLKRHQHEHTMPTCFWCHNDRIAIWTLQALRELGFSVPQDISVVGFDGADWGLQEHLTTISLPFFSLGAHAVQTLMEYCDHGLCEDNRIIRMPTSLLLGKTLVAAPSKAPLADAIPTF